MEVLLEVSARHLHIAQEDFQEIFGKDDLTKFKDISQPGQFAANEKVTISGPKGTIENVRILGPFRDKTQIELAITDCYRLGVEPVVALSGDLDNASTVTISGPVGSIERPCAIAAERHLHLSTTSANEAGLKQGDQVSIEVPGRRGLIFHNVVVRTDEKNADSFQIDTDEANAAGAKTGDMVSVLR